MLTRAQLAAHADDLLVPHVPSGLRKWVTTGGSTGKPVGFWLDRAIGLSEWRFITHQWRRVGYGTGSWRVILRGRLVPGAKPIALAPMRRELRLSTFHLDTDHIASYGRAIARMPRPFLHAYPSSANRLFQLCEETQTPIPRFRALLLGSEQVGIEQRELLAAQFGAPVYTWYGQSEKVLLGGECSYSRSYHLFPTYGVAEILDDDARPITEPGRVGRLVGTGLLNVCAPLVRYETGDLASWSDGPCACGFAGQRLESVAGRSQDVLFTPAGAQVGIAALNLHSRVYDNVHQLQYDQTAVDSVLVRVVPTPKWDAADQGALTQRLVERLPGVAIEVAVVERIDPEPNGKTPVLKPRR